MSTELRIICRPEISSGFGLTSLPVIATESLAQAIAGVEEALTDPTIGVVLLEETFHAHLPEALRRKITRRPVPMVVPFPAPRFTERPGAADAYIVELLRQVIGYRVRLR